MNRFIFFILLLAATAPNVWAQTSCSGNGDTTDLACGLSALWTFDAGQGTAVVDSSPNDTNGANNGTLQGSPLPTWVTGEIGDALSFQSTGQKVQTSADPIAYNTVTVCAWVNPSVMPPVGQYFPIVSNGYFYMWLYNNGNSPTDANNPLGTELSILVTRDDNHAASSVASIKLNNSWTNICAVSVPTSIGSYSQTGNSTTSLYINGVLSGSANQNSGNPYTGNVTIAGGAYPVEIDEVRIYSRALAASEMLQIYNNGITAESTSPAFPAGSTISQSSLTSTGVTLTWPAATAGGAVTGYYVYRCAGSNCTESTTTPTATTVGASYTDTGLTENTTYSYTVQAYNNGAAPSALLPQLNVTTLQSAYTPPTVPTGLGSSLIYATQATLSWNASTDTPQSGETPATVAGYYVYKNGNSTPIATTSALTYTDTGLTANTAYTYTVAAYNTADLPSAQSSAINVTTNLTPVPLIPDLRRINWAAYTGVPGGIPNFPLTSPQTINGVSVPVGTIINVKNICTDSNGNTYQAIGNGTADDTAAIQCAINSATKGDVVYIPTGNYLISSTLDVNVGHNYIAIRGAGADQTIIHSQGPRTFTIGTTALSLLGGATIASAQQLITGGATKGSTQLTLTTTTGIAVGNLIMINRNNDPDLVYSTGGYQRLMSQMLMVTGVNAQTNTITFSPPLIWDFSANPISGTATPAASPILITTAYDGGDFSNRYVGLENLKIDNTNSTSFSFDMESCYGCWVKGIYSYNSPAYHAVIIASLRGEIRDSLIAYNQRYGMDTGGLIFDSYTGIPGVGDSANTGFKVENNIFYRLGSGIEMNSSSSGNYLGYNFAYNYENIIPGWSGPMFDDNHGPHTMMNLWEGNSTERFQADGFFGSSSHGTYFRNHMYLYNPDPSININFIGLKLDRWSYYYNVIGNVLGQPNPPAGLVFADTTDLGYSVPVLMQFGFANIGNDCAGDCGPNDGAADSIPSFDPPGNDDPYPDQRVASTTLLSGNYDFVHNCTWDNTNNVCLSTQDVTNLKLPASLYYDGVNVPTIPPWWPTTGTNQIPWPPIGPDVANITNNIPSEQCFFSTNVGCTFSSDGTETCPANGGTFSASTCYPADFGTTPSVPYGDVNGAVDGSGNPVVSIVDAELTAQVAVGIQLPAGTNFNTAAAEVDGLKTVDINDAFLIAEYAIKKISTFPAGPA